MESTVIILAGGQSSRMGTNKALLTLDGKANIENQVQEAKMLSKHVLIVTNDFKTYEFLGIPMIEDRRKGFGPLAGLEAGLLASETENNLLVACDMPFFKADLGIQLLDGLQEFEAVMPHVDGKLHPLFAAYRSSILPQVQQALDNKQRRMASLLERVDAKIMAEDDFKEGKNASFSKYFFNMNHPEEYEQAKRMGRHSKDL